MTSPVKPSEFLRRHLAGGAHDLDDLVSWHARLPEVQDVLERLHAINNKFSLAGEPPLGVYKDVARPDLIRLAEELEQAGR